jgi:hypothetical protein
MRRSIALAAVLAGLTASPAVAAQAHFRSPSGNINCLAADARSGGPFVSCLLRKAVWRNPLPRPKSCDLDWDPHAVGIGRDTVTVGDCRGDIGPLCTLEDRCRTLAYGRSLVVGPYRCWSARIELTCRYRYGRHRGFAISRQRYRLFR